MAKRLRPRTIRYPDYARGTGYVRGSGGFVAPRGNIPSGTTYGPTAAERTTKARDAQKRILALYDKAQAEHKKVMARIAKSETATVDRLTKAYIESKKEDPEDALGNKTESEMTRYLGERLKSVLSQASQRARQTATPEAAGVTPEQLKTIGEEGPYVPKEGEKAPSVAPKPTPAGGRLQPPTVTPLPGMKMRVKSNGVEVELTGEQREGPRGTEVMAMYQGKRGWVPQLDLEPIYAEETRGREGLQRFFNPPQREFQPF